MSWVCSSWWGVAVVVVASVACDSGSGIRDAGADGGGADTGGAPDSGLPIDPPAIPWLEDGKPPTAPPSWSACRAGWREVTDSDSDSKTCEPYAAEGPMDCGPGEGHFPGTPGCAPVGAPCPAGDFAEGLPAGAIYVRVGAGGGGDGTAAAPYGSLGEVPWFALPTGSTVALAKGTYDGVLRLMPTITVVGACAAETIVTGQASPSENPIALVSPGDRITVRDISVSDPVTVPIDVRSGRSVSLESVVIERMPDTAVFGTGGEISLHRVVIRDGATPNPGAAMRGIVAAVGTRIEASETLVEGVFSMGVFAQDPGSTISLSDVVVRQTRPEPTGDPFGFGLYANGGAVISADHTLLEGNRNHGVLALGDDARVVLNAVIVRDTLLPESGPIQTGAIIVGAGAALEANKLLVDRYFEYGIAVAGAGSSVAVTDAILHAARESTPGRDGRGLGALDGARLTAQRVRVAEHDGGGVFFAGAGTTVVVDDLTIRDAAPAGLGYGMYVGEGADVGANRVLIERVYGAGVVATHPGSVLRLADAVVRGVEPVPVEELYGDGVQVSGGARLEISRLLLDENHRVGLGSVDEGTTLQVEDMVIRDTEPQASTGEGGYGLYMSESSAGTILRARFERNHRAAVVAGTGSTLELSHAVVDEVIFATCDASGCSDVDAAHGIIAARDGAITMSDFAVVGAELCGIMVATNGAVRLSQGLVARSEIGACVQVDGYDLDLLTGDVRYVDNMTNLETTTLPVPSAPGALPDPG